MSSNKEYHDFLKFLYFEGYADSYEEAEELVESLSDDEIEYLYEARRKRKLAHSFPLTEPERKYVENIRRRLEGEIVPPGGSARKRSARKPEPEPEPEPSPTRSASKKRITFDDRSQASYQGNTRRTRSLNAEFDLVADYLFSEGYADSLDGAEVMAENISASWVNEIIEKFNPEDYEEYHQKNHRKRNQSDEWDAQERDWQDSKGDIRDKHTQARGVRKKKGVK